MYCSFLRFSGLTSRVPVFCFVSALLKTPKTPGRCDSPFLTGCSSRWFRFPVLCAQAKYHGAQDVRGAPRGGGRVVQPKTVQAAETQHFYRGNHGMLCVEKNLAPCQRIGLCFWLILDDVDAHGNMANHFKLDHYGEQCFFTIGRKVNSNIWQLAKSRWTCTARACGGHDLLQGDPVKIVRCKTI